MLGILQITAGAAKETFGGVVTRRRKAVFAEPCRVASASASDISGAARAKVLKYRCMQIGRGRLLEPFFCKCVGATIVRCKRL
jgi:hypothetical protein